MKRTLAILLCLALLTSLLAGCMPGFRRIEPEQPKTPEEIRSAAAEKLRGAQSLGLDLKLSLSLDMQVDTETESLSLELELPGSLTTEPGAFQGTGSLRFAEGADNAESIPFSLCVIATDGGLDLYGRSEEDETYEKLRLELPESRKGEEITVALPELAWELETAETRYVLSHTVSAEEAAQLAQRVNNVSSEKASEALAQMAEYGFSPEAIYTGMFMRISVDKESLEPREISMDLSAGMKAAVEGLFRMILGQIQESIGGAEMEMPEFEIQELRFVISASLHDFNSVAPIQAPAEYEDLGGLEDLLDGVFAVPGFSGPGFDPDQDVEYGEMLERLDDSYSLEGFSFRLGEITPRTLTEQGWTVSDVISMGTGISEYESEDAEDGEEAEEPLTGDDTPEPETEAEAPGLSEDGLLAPGHMAQLYLKPAGSESEYDPLRLGVVNEGPEPCDCLDCPIYFFSVNEVYFYEGIEEGAVDFGGPAGIQKGMTAEQIKALLGEPLFENETDGLGSCYYATEQGQGLVCMLNGEGALAAMYYQDIAHYNPSDYVFHN